MYSKEERAALKKAFWEGFDTFCRNTARRRKRWTLYDTKMKGVAMKFDARRDGASVVLEMSQRNPAERLRMYDKLAAMQAYVEEAFGEPLRWEREAEADGGRPVSRIGCHIAGVDYHRQLQWMDIYRFFYEKMNTMESVFEDVKDFIK